MKTFLSLAALLFAFSAAADVVQPLGAGPQLLIPAAGSLPGNNGTFFRSDIEIDNLAQHDQLVLVQWLPQVGGQRAAATFTIKSMGTFRSDDFVSDVLRMSGLGSIIITGVQAGGTTADTTARLFASSRIWSPSPAGGTVSQSLPAIPPGGVNTPAAIVLGIGALPSTSLPTGVRVNAGVVNLDPVNTQTFDVQVVPFGSPEQTLTSAITVTLPPLTMQQVSFGTVGYPRAITISNTTSGTKSNLWTAYGSNVDNTSGDSWTQLAVAATTTP